MMDGIEKTLGLLPVDEINISDNVDDKEEIDEKQPAALTDNILPKTENFLDVDSVKHDREISNIHQKAIDAFELIMSAGQNVDPVRSARLFEVAGQFLKTAQDTTNDKLKRDIDIVKLKMAAKKIECAEGISGILEAGTEVMADRNEIIKQMIHSTQGPVIDGDIEK